MKCNRYKSSQLNIVVRYNFNHRFPKNLVLLLSVFCNCSDNEVVSSYKTQCSLRLPSLWCGTEIIIICCVSQTDTMIAISCNKDIFFNRFLFDLVALLCYLRSQFNMRLCELIPYFLEVSTYPNCCSRISSITDNLNSGEYFLNICPFFAIKNAPPKSV